MATAVARVAFAADCGGAKSSKMPKVAAAINAAFGRFAAKSADVAHHRRRRVRLGLDGHHGALRHLPQLGQRLRRPHGHDAGEPQQRPGGATAGDAKAWLAYNSAKGTKTRTNGGWIDQANGIPLTDQYLDIGGIRFIIVNSGGVRNADPGWPVPVTGGPAAGNPRVAWPRSAWARGGRTWW